MIGIMIGIMMIAMVMIGVIMSTMDIAVIVVMMVMIGKQPLPLIATAIRLRAPRDPPLVPCKLDRVQPRRKMASVEICFR